VKPHSLQTSGDDADPDRPIGATFLIGIMLILLSAWSWRWFPSAAGTLSHLVMPALTAGRLRHGQHRTVDTSAMLDVLGLDYINTRARQRLSNRRSSGSTR